MNMLPHTKKCNLCSSFAAFTNEFSQTHIYLMFKSIISRIVTIVFYKSNEKCLVKDDCTCMMKMYNNNYNNNNNNNNNND